MNDIKILTDAHAHLDDSAFDEDRKAVLESMRSQMKWVINSGCDMASSRVSCELAAEYDFIYACAGIHPQDADKYDDACERELEHLLGLEKCVAAGEIGLDYHYDGPERDIQKEAFIRQLKLADRCGVPAVIHSRDAVQDTYDILKNEMTGSRGAVLHSFSQSEEMLRRYLELNVYFSLSGIVTFKNAVHVRDTVKLIPADRFFIETDCPYMTPVPERGRRNDPAHTRFTAASIAQLKGQPFERICETAAANGEKFFGINV